MVKRIRMKNLNKIYDIQLRDYDYGNFIPPTMILNNGFQANVGDSTDSENIVDYIWIGYDDNMLIASYNIQNQENDHPQCEEMELYNIDYIEYEFGRWNPDLTSVTLYNIRYIQSGVFDYDTPNLNEIRFLNCHNLSIESDTFSGCSHVTIVIPDYIELPYNIVSGDSVLFLQYRNEDIPYYGDYDFDDTVQFKIPMGELENYIENGWPAEQLEEYVTDADNYLYVQKNGHRVTLLDEKEINNKLDEFLFDLIDLENQRYKNMIIHVSDTNQISNGVFLYNRQEDD